MKLTSSSAIAVLVFIGSVVLGFVVVKSGWRGYLKRFPELREVAQVNERRGASNIEAVETPLEDVIRQLTVTQVNGIVTVGIPNFVTSLEDKEPVLPCRLYDQIEINFRGDGVAEAGEKPLIAAYSSCPPNTSAGALVAIRIPLNQMNAKEADGLDPVTNARLQLKNMVEGFTPEVWTLELLRFYNTQDPELSFSITGDQIFKVREESLGFRLPPDTSLEGDEPLPSEPVQRLPTSNQVPTSN